MKFVDRQDFMNEVNKEKKLFERLLDDCVANGLDRTIQVKTLICVHHACYTCYSCNVLGALCDIIIACLTVP